MCKTTSRGKTVINSLSYSINVQFPLKTTKIQLKLKTNNCKIYIFTIWDLIILGIGKPLPYAFYGNR